jgi:two-component system phosphate regulon response regulator PhoB
MLPVPRQPWIEYQHLPKKVNGFCTMANSALSTVVVADPDPAYQRQIIALLQRDFRCLVANSLREAYQVIQHEQPGMVTLELNQPDGDGIALIEYLQADPMLRQVLIACVTTRSSVKDKVQAFRAGADDYIVKPLTPATNFTGRMLLLRRLGLLARTAPGR